MQGLTAQGRHAAVEQLLSDLGYGTGLREAAFPVWIGPETLELDYVGFGRPQPRDMTTATVACLVSEHDEPAEDYLDAARALATPALFHAGPEEISLLAVSRDKATSIHHQAYGERILQNERLRADLAPDALLAAKRADRQLSLFPMDVALLSEAREKSSSRLSARVADALRLAQRILPKETSPQGRYRLVVAAIAALMVRDKLELGPVSGSQLIDVARKRFPSYFGALGSESAIERDVLLALLADLEEGLDYKGLDPAVVSEVYEHAVIA